ncbi:MAG TPA: PEP-CTERM sorting domain-containing protein, partial [Terriglobales bacterium]|nr:PEP-CTERM sorting domain-containing protein [Terriglobales bacterium]
AVSDVVITFTADHDFGGGAVTFNLVLDTALTGTGGLANFFSQDIVSTGSLAGTPNAVQQNITTPAGETTVPEPGTMLLLGTGLLSLAGGIRRKMK